MKEVLLGFKNHLIAILVFVICAVAYFIPQFQGKEMEMGDINNYKRMAHEAISYEKETGEVALWTNAIFAGMPTYQISAPMRTNLIKYVEQGSRFFIPRPAGYYIMGMIGFYLLMILLGVNHWIAMISAICFAFTTNTMVIFEAGHTSKVRALMTAAPVLAGVLLVFRKNYLLGGLVFAIAFALNLYSNHPQMTFYLGIILGILVIGYFIESILNKELAHFGKSVAILVLMTLVGVGTSASKLWTTYEYGQDTMRGKPILSKTASEGSSSDQEGLDWEYAMVYSNEKKDLLSMIIPLAIGGGSTEMLGKNSAFAKEMRKRGADTRNGIPAPSYWGNLPINGGPVYMGAIVMFLFLLSFITLKGTLKWWGLVAVVLTLLFSLGKNSSIVNGLFFDYFPLFKQFRTPNSVIGITSILIPFIAFYGLDKYLKTENRNNKTLYIAAGITSGICLLFAFMGSVFFDFIGINDARYTQMGYAMDSLVDERKSMLMIGGIKSAAMIIIAAGLLYMSNIGKIKTVWVVLVIGLIAAVDLFSVGKRYLNQDDFKTARKLEENFKPRPVDLQILQDKDPYYRVLDLSINTWNSSEASYFHKTIGGYHAAKLQRTQDIIVNHISKNNIKVLNMLNTKYIIQPTGDGKATAQLNSAALGNAWFVNNINIVPDADTEISRLNDFDPLGDAIIHQEFKDYIGGLNPNKNGTIKLTSYSPNKLTYSANTSSDQLALFSEVWYGPDKGWEATIDGQKVDHIRANYILRALKVPAGKHEIVFEFNPSTYRVGEMIGLICSLLLIIGLLGYIYLRYKGSDLVKDVA